MVPSKASRPAPTTAAALPTTISAATRGIEVQDALAARLDGEQFVGQIGMAVRQVAGYGNLDGPFVAAIGVVHRLGAEVFLVERCFAWQTRTMLADARKRP